MTYTVWMYGRLIGEAALEIGSNPARRAGPLNPTSFGLSVLPGVTDMFPALVAFGESCRRRGTEAGSMGAAGDEDVGAFARTPEGQRVITAARLVEKLVVRDPEGRVIAWDSIAITDGERFPGLARAAATPIAGSPSGEEPGPADPLRFRMSMTLAHDRLRGRMVRKSAAIAVGFPRPALES